MLSMCVLCAFVSRRLLYECVRGEFKNIYNLKFDCDLEPMLPTAVCI